MLAGRANDGRPGGPVERAGDDDRSDGGGVEFGAAAFDGGDRGDRDVVQFGRQRRDDRLCAGARRVRGGVEDAGFGHGWLGTDTCPHETPPQKSGGDAVRTLGDTVGRGRRGGQPRFPVREIISV